MDLNDVRSAMTVILLAVFVGIVFWAYSRRRREAFEAAAQLPLADDGSGADAPAHRSNGA